MSEDLALSGDNGLPIFTSDSWEEHVSAWLDVSGRELQCQLFLAAIAYSVSSKWTPARDKTMAQFAGEVGRTAANISQYVKAYELLRNLNQFNFRNTPLSFTHFIVAGQSSDTPEEFESLLNEAEDDNLTVESLRDRIRKRRPSKAITNPPEGLYRTIVIDPPWQMEKIEREVRPKQHGFDYPTMTEDELMSFPLPDIAAPDCHLYLWTTHKHLPLAFRLAEHWGFNYECLMTWVKNVGFTPYSWMRSTEHVLFCRKGNLSLERLGLRLDFNAKVREHSRKPDEFYNLVKEVSPGPRIDVFSREPREGFDQWGNETDKFEEVARDTASVGAR